ncbi:MAG: DUF3568 family protein [Planctomycetes bacterium]|nr:DUF3568 family protein [Planctomycetota bacterium]
MRLPMIMSALLFCSLSLQSCILVAAGAIAGAAYGAVSYSNNEATMEVTQDFTKVFAAAKKALRKLQFQVDDTQVATATEGTLKSSDVTVDVERLPGNTTRVRAKVGTFATADNERRAKLILEEIKLAL